MAAGLCAEALRLRCELQPSARSTELAFCYTAAFRQPSVSHVVVYMCQRGSPGSPFTAPTHYTVSQQGLADYDTQAASSSPIALSISPLLLEEPDIKVFLTKSPEVGSAGAGSLGKAVSNQTVPSFSSLCSSGFVPSGMFHEEDKMATAASDSVLAPEDLKPEVLGWGQERRSSR
ncbi:unnamed protein product [Rangifer tarandus platyrhynchus]|uniref:Uncharacterized protein n=2 Tax=Rangifer tarandus platyrhynchus TaxID=3082113 RepID=A0ABN8XZS9_RANTA|nr:unnamed protein product [Rangifer tarandus platyrhynchus]CAI9712669.1 unnamed protein product [Rangifer tarandus platyrhynchus]